MAKKLVRQLQKIDEQLSYQLYKLYPKTSQAKQILRGLEYSCNGIGWLVISVLMIYNNPLSQAYKSLLVGVVLTQITVSVVKALSRRRRPSYAILKEEADKNSFPSGHATMATFIALFAIYHRILPEPLALWAMAVVVSRVLIGRHFISDAAGSALIGYVLFHVQFNDYLGLNAIILSLMKFLLGF